ASAMFSNEVDYVFRIRRVAALRPLTLETMPLDITCAFDQGDGGAEQQPSCSGPGGAPADASMKVFAGLRADPDFFDRQGALATVARGRLSFSASNAFAGTNVLALVVELDASVFRPDGAPPSELAVSGETIRRGR